MAKILQLGQPDDIGAFRDIDGASHLDPAKLRLQCPDATWLVVEPDGRIGARCSLWWSQTPSYPPERLGVIGHFAAGDRDSARQILDHALRELTGAGCTMAVGPMDKNTWYSYRFLTDRGDQPAFFMEPDNPHQWPSDFIEAGFEPMAEYFSAVAEDLSVVDSRVERAQTLLADKGVGIRPFRLEDFDDELGRIYEVSVGSFGRNFLYTPIGEDEFRLLYLPIKDYLKPDLVLIAERGERPVGFVFNMLDYAQARRGDPIDTIIVKTVAILPGRAYAGLGVVLVAESHRIASQLGYRRAIHALMHSSNMSLNISGHYARPFRRYTLFSRKLQT